MNHLISAFPQQIIDAVNIAKTITSFSPKKNIQKILVSGLGGSGIGADYVRVICRDVLPIPYLVNRDYHIPSFVDENTLSIFSSYSGNTEETLQAFEETLAKNAQIVCISSGGKLSELAAKHNLLHIALPSGYPPRAALALSIVQQLFLIQTFGYFDKSIENELLNIANYLIKNQEEIKLEAQKIAHFIGDSLPIIYTTHNFEPLAIRCRQQLNENAKILCWHHVLPEMNHNEIVGWTESHPDKKVIFIHNEVQEASMRKHTDFLKNVVQHLAENIYTLNPKGDNPLAQFFITTHVIDWVSWYVAEARAQDAMQVNVIQKLKENLAQ